VENNTRIKGERSVLFGLITQDQPWHKTREHLDELEFLALTAGAQTVETFTQKLAKPDPKTLMGRGKLGEIRQFIEKNEIDMIIFDDDLSASQVRNLERELNCKIVDRSLLILDIFSLRARTAQAKTQVELAQYQYLLPRLTNLWTHLSKQKGGIGMKGPGETELETDRRIVRDKIALLKKKLEKIDRQSINQRKNRGRWVRVALVGYTNVGKSSLMNLLAKTEAFSENKLFATVDSLVRKVVINRIPFLLTDTVGFIRKLPHALIECFKSTLDEVREADILVHMVDISQSNFEEQKEIVDATLNEIGAGDKPTLIVFNKIDLVNGLNGERENGEGDEMDLKQFATSYKRNHNQQVAFISVTQKEHIDELRKVLFKRVKDLYYTIYPNYLKDLTGA